MREFETWKVPDAHAFHTTEKKKTKLLIKIYIII